MDILRSFSERLNDFIEESELSIEELSDKLAISPSSLYNWKSGTATSFPSVSNLVKLADFFKCSIDYLIGLDFFNNFKTPHHNQDFKSWFKTAIKTKGYNLHRLGKEINMGTGQYYAWINGVSEPSLESLMRIAKLLNCTIDYLVGREN